MAIAFKNLKSPLLGLYDVIGFGQYKGCRAFDVADDWEYWEFIEKKGFYKLTHAFRTKVLDHKQAQLAHRHKEEEVDPYLNDNGGFFDDIPF